LEGRRSGSSLGGDIAVDAAARREPAY